MPFIDKLLRGTPALSYEIFPPKNPLEWGALYETMGRIAKAKPDFVSVTYRGGVSTRARTVELVDRIQRELAIEAVAHLTCITHTKAEIRDILSDLEKVKVSSIIALRGDMPRKPVYGEFRHASELIQLVKLEFGFNIACAFYPEKHPDAQCFEDDINFLKYKQDCGASFAISQFFFDNEQFYRFRDLAVKSGVTIPLIAGIMPVSTFAQLQRFKELSGTDVPNKLIAFLNESENVEQQGIAYGIKQCEDLLDHGIGGIHLYTLNKSKSTFQITRQLSKYFPTVT